MLTNGWAQRYPTKILLLGLFLITYGCSGDTTAKKETIVKTPGLSGPCTMEYCKGLLTAFGLGFTPHVQRKARTDLHLCAHAIDVALHLAIAPVATFHRIGRGGQQRIIEKRQGFFQRGGKELLQRVPEGWEPLDATPQRGQFVDSGLGPTAPIEQRVYLFHDRTQYA